MPNLSTMTARMSCSVAERETQAVSNCGIYPPEQGQRSTRKCTLLSDRTFPDPGIKKTPSEIVCLTCGSATPKLPSSNENCIEGLKVGGWASQLDLTTGCTADWLLWKVDAPTALPTLGSVDIQLAIHEDAPV